MTDQTKYGIEEIQSQNKAKARAEQNEMREELKNLFLNAQFMIYKRSMILERY